MRRRNVLQVAAMGAGTVLAGCLGKSGAGSTPPQSATDSQQPDAGSTPQQPDECPASQDLDVDWPDDLTQDTVGSFVEEYENAYYREKVVEFEQETGLEEYALSGNVASGPTESGAGYEVEVSGSGGVYRPTLDMAAMVADPPEDVAVHSTDSLDTGLASLLRDAADDPGEEVTQHVTNQSTIGSFVETINALADGEPLTGKHDSATLYFDVDGTTVELAVEATSFHGDYWWNARYYVDENVVRRTTDEGVDPSAGELLECRVEP